ncbi:H/ACA ribonucleoprotein complex subunit 2-like [Sceloporus undulatus]|uniref:H/ACA ribonucleoprotein complex subunit 2-like n=1 Tax=Sceloporus undulatus TaxID=8520 RepID=UPI001C4A95D2|nr:H/ACA ribonucleoprotein complex subunit 2-like [Sceloporus undulatus]
MGRVKQHQQQEAAEEEAEASTSATPERSYHELVENVNCIAQPLASRKLTRKLYKCIKKGPHREGGRVGPRVSNALP